MTSHKNHALFRKSAFKKQEADENITEENGKKNLKYFL